MNDKELIKTLKMLIDKYGAAAVAAKLGYKSSLTPLNWLGKKRIPHWAANHIRELGNGGIAA